MRFVVNPRLALQAMAIKMSANLVVQFLRDYRSPTPVPLDWQQVLEFAIYGFLGSQFNNIFQFIIEDQFPTNKADILPGHHQPEKKDDTPVATGTKKRFNFRRDVIWLNVLIKLVLDQTIGLFISGCIFLTCTNIARVPHPYMVLVVIRQRLWPLMQAGWHIWPLVTVCSFLWVPVRSRVLVSVCVGFGWSIFLSVFAMRT